MRLLIKLPWVEKKRLLLKSDSEKIYSILTNLFKNAIKYSEQVQLSWVMLIESEPSQEKLEFYDEERA